GQGLRQARHQGLRHRPGTGRQVEGRRQGDLLEGLRREIGRQCGVPQSLPGSPGGVRLLGYLNRAIVVLSSIALVVASCVLTYSVVLRYFSPQPTDWQDEVSGFLLIGVSFMSAAWVQSERGHIGIEAVASLMSQRANHVRLKVVDGASALFCAFFAWKSWTLLHEAWV